MIFNSQKKLCIMLGNILDHIKDFSFVHMLFFLPAAQASTALPARYRRLG
jgi:hypothetical protein